MPIIECPRCKAKINFNQAPVQDIVAQWSDNVFTDERPVVAGLTPDGALAVGLMNQENKRVLLNIQLGVDMPQMHGPPQPFKLVEIAPGVLKLTPSLFDPSVHAFLTIVDAPAL